MWLLAFSILALMIGADMRDGGRDLSYASRGDGAADHMGQNVSAIGAWTSFAGAVCLNIAVWHLI